MSGRDVVDGYKSATTEEPGLGIINAVSKILNNPILVHGPKTPEFENLFCKFTQSKNAIAVSSCTAGLHLFYFSKYSLSNLNAPLLNH